MKEVNKLSNLFESKEQTTVTDDQLVNDPRIESPDIKVILPEEPTQSMTKVEPNPEQEPQAQEKLLKTTDPEEHIYDNGYLDEVEIVAKKEDKVEEPHVCEIGFVDAFKQNWLALTAIVVGIGIGCFFLGRVTKKVS